MAALPLRAWLRPSPRPTPRRTPLGPEPLEDRTNPSNWMVFNTFASGPGSLAEAVASANADTTPAVIAFDPAVAGQTVTLTGTLTLNNPTQPIEIDAPAGGLTIAGGGAASDFSAVHVQTGTTATLVGLTVGNGHVSGGGGGVSNDGTLTLLGCTFDSNVAGIYGGAVYSNGSLTATNCTFIHNAVNRTSGNYAYGGAIVSWNSLALTRCAFDSNSVTVAYGGYGGAIDCSGSATVADCTFTGNGGASVNYGGAISSRGSLAVTGTTFSGNAAPRWGGGAVYSEGPATVTASVFTQNSGGSGGGVVVGGPSATLTDCVFDRNTAADGNGGGLLNYTTSAALTRCTFTGNTAYLADGGAVNNNSGDGVVTLTDCTLDGNTANTGGGISNGGTLTVTGSTIVNNVATGNTWSSGGGVSQWMDGTAALTNCTIANNRADATLPGNGGGGVFQVGGYFTPPAITLTNCTVYGNTAATGGGIYNAVNAGHVGMLTLNNTIVAGSTGGGADLAGTFQGSNDLIGDGSGTGLTAPLSGDPKLGPLAPNGGPTMTMALLAGSPAIDAGSNALAVDAGNNPLTADQRGAPRVLGAAVDIGAFEQQPAAAPEITSAGQATFFVGAAGSFTVTTTGWPAPNIGLSSLGYPLPPGVTFTDNGNGTATFAGTPGSGTEGVYFYLIEASNGLSPAAMQEFALTVLPQTLATPTVTLFAADGTYDAAAHPATAAVAGTGGVPGPSLEGVSPTVTYYVGPTPTGTGSTTPPTAAGTYTAVAHFPGSAGYTAADSAPQTFTVHPKALAVIAADAFKAYGAPNPAFTATYAGFAPGEDASVLGGTLTFATPATAASHVGSYPVTPGGLTAANYDLSFQDGALLVIRAKLTVTADDQAMDAGGPVPPLTATYAGFVNGESAAVLTSPAVLATPAGPASPPGTYPITTSGAAAADYAMTYVDGTLTVRPLVGTPRPYAVGSGPGMAGTVRFLGAGGSDLFPAANPFGDFAGGVRVATGDVDGDGTPDVLAASGPGMPATLVVLDGATGKAVYEATPFGPGFTGGLLVAAGDFNHDGAADVVLTPDAGGGPRVLVLDGRTHAPLADFLAFEETFRGGVSAAVGDVDGDGTPDLVVGAGTGGAPRVAVFDGTAVAAGAPTRLANDFFAFEPDSRVGVHVAVGQMDGAGGEDVVVAPGVGGGPRVVVFTAASLLAPAGPAEFASFFAGNPDARGGAHVTTRDADGDGRHELLVGSGDGAGGRVAAYDPEALATAPPAWELAPFGDEIGGVFVG